MKILKTLFSYSVVVGMPFAMFYGTVMENRYAMNLVTFMCWFTAVMATFYLPVILSKKEEAGKLKKTMRANRIIPYQIDVIFDVAAFLLLAVTGRFLLAGLWVYQLILSLLLHNEDLDESEKAVEK